MQGGSLRYYPMTGGIGIPGTLEKSNVLGLRVRPERLEGRVHSESRHLMPFRRIDPHPNVV